MKLKTLTQFDDAIDQETAWRRRELTTLLFNVRESRESKIQVSLRAGVALLYAHWEGWIKSVGEIYVEYVSQQRLTYDQMSSAFLGTALRVRLNQFEETHSARLHSEFAEFVLDGGLQSQAKLSKGFVRTESNLSSTVLEDITARLGLPYAPYELLAMMVDERLVGARNKIAHGEYLDIDVTAYEELHTKVMQMLTRFTTDVINAAHVRAFMK